MKTLEEHINDVMDNYPFGKVARYMKAVKWTWQDNPLPPEESELRKFVREQMKECYERNGGMRSGGFAIEYTSGECQDGCWDRFDVDFSIASWDTA